MIPCIIESPFRGANKAEEQRNRAYLDKLIRHVVFLGFTPWPRYVALGFEDRIVELEIGKL